MHFASSHRAKGLLCKFFAQKYVSSRVGHDSSVSFSGAVMCATHSLTYAIVFNTAWMETMSQSDVKSTNFMVCGLTYDFLFMQCCVI